MEITWGVIYYEIIKFQHLIKRRYLFQVLWKGHKDGRELRSKVWKKHSSIVHAHSLGN